MKRRSGRSGITTKSSQGKRRQRSAKAAVRRGTMLLESDRRPRGMETRLAPPRYAERRHAKPGAGIKRSRAAMAKKSR